MKKIFILSAIALISVWTGLDAPAGQQPPQPPPLTVQNIKGHIYLVKGGSGANGGFFIGAKGVVVIDAKMTAEAAKQTIAEIRKITPLPITHLLITHSDLDHVNGLGGFPPGLKILAHAQTKKDMDEAFQKDEALKPLLAYLPNQTFTDDFDLKGLGEEIRLLYFGPAHTSGDIVVFFAAEKVAFIGDLAFIGRDPLIHKQKGGTSFGLVKALKDLLALDAETYIAGHNDPLTKNDIQGLMTSVEEKQAKVRDMIKAGRSLDEIKAAFGIAAAAGAPAGRSWPSLVEIIYQELTEKK
ncbi:MAG: MBL fold metallo-hydrolase [Candidatus Aminicenantes bacterium]|nr:MBL fold metallo-hydrolase [Candidatus Aminicenantes bacterium]